MDAVLARNVEFSQIITDYQRRLRENGEYVQTVEEKCRRLSVEVTSTEIFRKKMHVMIGRQQLHAIISASMTGPLQICEMANRFVSFFE